MNLKSTNQNAVGGKRSMKIIYSKAWKLKLKNNFVFSKNKSFKLPQEKFVCHTSFVNKTSQNDITFSKTHCQPSDILPFDVELWNTIDSMSC